MIGRPPVLLLDEPTTGVDPAARRALWDILLSLKQRANIAIVLTSHRFDLLKVQHDFTLFFSMEECEALCDTVGIMVAGRQRCFGSPQHLKNRWSQGYALQIKLKAVNAAEVVQEAVKRHFKGAQLKVIKSQWSEI